MKDKAREETIHTLTKEDITLRKPTGKNRVSHASTEKSGAVLYSDGDGGRDTGDRSTWRDGADYRDVRSDSDSGDGGNGYDPCC